MIKSYESYFYKEMTQFFSTLAGILSIRVTFLEDWYKIADIIHF